MLAYLSLSHLGYCMLGLFAVAAASAGALSDTAAALGGVFIQIFNHGLTAAALFYRRYSLARILIILETAFLLGSWGLSQYPYIIPPHVTIENAANDPNVIVILLISTGIGMVLILPALYYLFSVFKLPLPAPGVEKNEEHTASDLPQEKSM